MPSPKPLSPAASPGIDPFTRTPVVAYFSMEVALRSDIPTYAGGLGVLAGDTLRTAADMDLPVVGVTLVSRGGYFRQRLDADGRQQDDEDRWQPERWATPLNARICVIIDGRNVWVGAWMYVLTGHLGKTCPVLLLDTDLPDNAPADRAITDRLYGGDLELRLRQEIVLGIGGARLLQALEFNVRQYHLNEGHSALLLLHLLQRNAYPDQDVRAGESRYDIPRVREMCNFTTHTPVGAGFDRFPYPLVKRLLGDDTDLDTLKTLAGAGDLDMTQLALHLCDYVNGVAKSHARTSQAMFPGYRVAAITNGIHPNTWTSQSMAEVYDRYLPGWRYEPEILVRADCCLPDRDLWEAHVAAKQALIARVKNLCDVTLDPALPIVGFARRMTAYKRPDLLFSELGRLRQIAAERPFQVVMAGKAHPADAEGKALIERVHAHMHRLGDAITMAFLPNYDMDLAALCVSGADVWLNTPLPPLEASGTSGMKAAFNGVPNLSVLDGWWLEGCIEGVTGWAIESGPGGQGDGDALYDKLERVVLPLYHDDRAGWLRVMKGAIAKNASFFNSQRMMRRYATDAYLR